MILKKKKLRYQDLINTNTSPSAGFTSNVIDKPMVSSIADKPLVSSMQTMQKPKPNEKIQKILEEVKPQIIEQLQPKFVRPKTDEEWKQFHKMNEEGMKKAYESPNSYYKDGNKLYIAGTKDMGDVMDWIKIPTGNFKDSKIYKNIEPVFRDDKDIDYIVGHSAGGSAALELEKNYTDRKITSVTYNAPVFERADYNKVINEDMKPMRFAISGDPVSMFDMNAQTTFKAPDIDLKSITNIVNTYTDPSLNNIINTNNSGMPDVTMGLHSMSGSYSDPSKPVDFLQSAVKSVAVGKTLGIV